MSLISEALKKARQEAARQDAQRPRSPYAVGAAESTERRPGLVAVLAGVGVGCLAAGLILAAVWAAGWGPFARPAKPVEQAAATAPASPPPVQPASEPAAVPPAMIEESAPPQPVEESRPPVGEARPAAPADPPAARPVPAPPPPAAAEEDRAAAAIPSAPPPAAPAPAPPVRPAPPAGAGLVDGQTYVGEVPVPGGGMVKLNGIVFSQDQPVAMLDGRVMAPGEIIQGFTVAAIEAGRVKLQGYGATVFVSPK
ncbi:MAG TPA: hypothetical protein VIC28_06295 [Thermoanaerobaculia bacterium]|jgi:hypothetical protein